MLKRMIILFCLAMTWVTAVANEEVGPTLGIGDAYNDSKPIYGAGVRALLDGAHLRLEYDRIDWDAFDSERISLNVAWLF